MIHTAQGGPTTSQFIGNLISSSSDHHHHKRRESLITLSRHSTHNSNRGEKKTHQLSSSFKSKQRMRNRGNTIINSDCYQSAGITRHLKIILQLFENFKHFLNKIKKHN